MQSESENQDSASIINFFKDGADLSYLEGILKQTCEERFLLYGLNEKELKIYFKDRLKSEFEAPDNFFKIKKLLPFHINANDFIKKKLIKSFCEGVLNYSVEQIEVYFLDQIEEAEKKYAIIELSRQVKDMQVKAECLLNRWESFDKKINKILIREKNSDVWDQLYRKCQKKGTATNNTSFVHVAIMIAIAAIPACIFNHKFKKSSLSILYLSVGALVVAGLFFGIKAAYYKGMKARPDAELKAVLSGIVESYVCLHQSFSPKPLSPEDAIFSQILLANRPKPATTLIEEVKEEKSEKPIKRKHLPTSDESNELSSAAAQPLASQISNVSIEGKGTYVRLLNGQGIETRIFYHCSPPPVSEIEAHALEVVSGDPTIHAADSTGQPGLKWFGPGEIEEYRNCVAKFKSYSPFWRSARFGVRARDLDPYERAQLPEESVQIWEIDPDVCVRK
jgi:hypothetical protein